MTKFGVGISEHPEAAVAAGEALGQISDRFEGERPDLTVAFFTPHHLSQSRNIANAIHEILMPRAAIGASVSGVIGGGQGIEAGPGISIWAAKLDGVRVTTMLLDTSNSPDGGEVRGWPDHGCEAGTLILLADPFSFPLDRFLASLNVNLPEVAVAGGFVSAGVAPEVNRLIADLSTAGRGAVGVLVEASPLIDTAVIEASRPIGKAFTVTAAEAGTIFELGGKPALERLEETFNEIDVESKRLMSAGMQLGTVLNEQQDEFGPGDFQVRDLAGADESDKSITTGEVVEVGQTVQFHVRDPAAVQEKLSRALSAGDDSASALVFAPMGAGIADEVLAGDLHRSGGGGVYRPCIAGAYCAGQAGRIENATAPTGGNRLFPDAVTLATFGI